METGANYSIFKAYCDARQLKRILLSEMVQVRSASIDSLVKARYDKFRGIGRYSSRISVTLSRDMSEIQNYLAERLMELREYLPSRAVEVPLEGETEEEEEETRQKKG